MSNLMVIAQVAGKRIAVEASRVQSVIDLENVIGVPGTEPHVVGLTALRSLPMTVIDSSIVIGKRGVDDPTGARAMVIEEQGHYYALLVEDVFEVVETDGEPLPVPGNLEDGWQGVGASMIETGGKPALLVDPSSLLGSATGLAA